MKKSTIVSLGLSFALSLWGIGEPESEVVNGVTWYFRQATGGASYAEASYLDESTVGWMLSAYGGETHSAVSTNTTGAIVVPDVLGGRPVTGVCLDAFKGCKYLTSITLPASIRTISGTPFAGCSSLMSVIFKGDAPEGVQSDSYSGTIFNMTPRRLVVYVPRGSIGWNGSVTTALPESWCGRAITHEGESYDWDGGQSPVKSIISLTVTNTIIHYVVNSVQPPMAGPITSSTGFVNVLTEIKGGAVAIPESWVSNYPTFQEKYGVDFGAALTKRNGKKDSEGNEMLVWQDYVAGTDPTDESDNFTASITLVEGKPFVSYSPELPETEKAKRKYTILGKVRLADADWTEVNGNVEEFNFFKVTVEMRK